MEAVEEGEGRGVGLRAGVEDEVVCEGGLAGLGEEGEGWGEEGVGCWVVVLEEAVWEGVRSDSRVGWRAYFGGCRRRLLRA